MQWSSSGSLNSSTLPVIHASILQARNCWQEFRACSVSRQGVSDKAHATENCFDSRPAPLPQIQRQQLPQRLLLRDVRSPAVGSRDRGIKSRVRACNAFAAVPSRATARYGYPATGSSTHAGGFSQRSRSSTSRRAAASSELPNRNGDKLPLCLRRRVCVLARMRKVAATDGWRFRCSDMSAPAGLPVEVWAVSYRHGRAG